MMPPRGSVSCPGCGRSNVGERPRCRCRDTRLPASRKAARALWMTVAIPATMISLICLVIVFPQVIAAGKPEKWDAMDFVTAIGVVFVPLCFTLFAWANCCDPQE